MLLVIVSLFYFKRTADSLYFTSITRRILYYILPQNTFLALYQRHLLASQLSKTLLPYRLPVSLRDEVYEFSDLVLCSFPCSPMYHAYSWPPYENIPITALCQSFRVLQSEKFGVIKCSVCQSIL